MISGDRSSVVGATVIGSSVMTHGAVKADAPSRSSSSPNSCEMFEYCGDVLWVSGVRGPVPADCSKILAPSVTEVEPRSGAAGPGSPADLRSCEGPAPEGTGAFRETRASGQPSAVLKDLLEMSELASETASSMSGPE